MLTADCVAPVREKRADSRSLDEKPSAGLKVKNQLKHWLQMYSDLNSNSL